MGKENPGFQNADQERIDVCVIIWQDFSTIQYDFQPVFYLWK
jgi:hypothetical protein